MAQQTKVSDLITEVMLQVKSETSSMATIAAYKQQCVKFQNYCNENGLEFYTDKIAKSYLARVKLDHPEYCYGYMMHIGKTLRRLECVNSGVKWHPMRRARKEYTKSCFDKNISEYAEYLSKTKIKQKYLHGQIHNVAWFLGQVDAYGIRDLADLSAECIYPIFCDTPLKHNFRHAICTFLKYAHTYGLIPINLAPIVPSVQRHHAVPSVYSPIEVEQILSSVVYTSQLGKRDYAILLIAARLGLRAGDIAAMTFDCLRSETMEIFRQEKTKRKLTLPLLDEIKTAIDDYVENFRPKSDDKHIFLNKGGYGSISPASVGAIAQRAILRAEIDCKYRRSGSHSLRASLATALIAEGNDYYTVQKILDHIDIQTTKSYVKADVEQLRINAIPIPAPSGNFAKILSLGSVTV